MSDNRTRKFMLTNLLVFFKLGTLTATRPSARAKSSGSGCSAHPLSFPSRVGYDLSKQPIPTTEIENRWPSCLRSRGLNGTSDTQLSNLGNADPATEWPSRLDDASFPDNPCVEIRARDWQVQEQPAQAIRPARRHKATAGMHRGLIGCSIF
jgi:hypothetical protein